MTDDKGGASSIENIWTRPLVCIGLYLVTILSLYWVTMSSMIHIWVKSETFTHGFIIAPVTLWLIWQNKDQLKSITPNIEPLFILPLVGAGMLWFVGYLVDAQVIQQLSLVLLIIFGICSLLGFKISKILAFPLFFLLLMVPMGENLVPKMMDFTASSTVWLIRQSGVPVYREGLFFSLPSGNWSVVEACSGIRYLIASVTLGCLYAYLTYHSLLKRLVFVLISIVVPIVANTLRAYMIVMIGHASDMKLAVGVDHLIYGWLFFGVVIFLMFLIGSIFRDKDTAIPRSNTPPGVVASTGNKNYSSMNFMTYMALLAIGLTSVSWPMIPKVLPDSSSASMKMVSPFVPKGWNFEEVPTWQWQPLMTGADSSLKRFYVKDEVVIGLFINQYANQSQGSELVSTLDRWVIPELKEWHLIEQRQVRITIYDQPVLVEQARIKSSDTELLVWRWYRIGQRDTANPLVAKSLEALSKLSFQSKTSARVYVVTPVNGSLDHASDQLQSFVKSLSPELEVSSSLQKEMM